MYHTCDQPSVWVDTCFLVCRNLGSLPWTSAGLFLSRLQVPSFVLLLPQAVCPQAEDSPSLSHLNHGAEVVARVAIGEDYKVQKWYGS